MVKGTSFFSGFLGFLFGLWVVMLWILSSIPGNDVHLPPFPGADKAAHFAYYFVGGFLLALVLRMTLGWRGWKLTCSVLFVMALIGALDELHQLHTQGRSGGDPVDWMADCAGGALGALMIGWMYARGKNRGPQASSGAVAQGD
jgi:VanZ family protein